MDLSAWSSSDTTLVIFIVLGFVGQVVILFYRTGQLEKQIDTQQNHINTCFNEIEAKINQQSEAFSHAIERLEDRMDKQFEEVNHKLSLIDTSLQQLNQNHIDHLNRHQNWV